MATKPLFRGKNGKIIPFDQAGDFFHRLGHAKLDRNNYVDALVYYRRALEKEPGNAEYELSMAEVFTEIGCFEESNRILLCMVHEGGAQALNECFFGIGCNFIGMQEYDKAQESFNKYLDLDPDGEYADDANDILDVLEEQESFSDSFSSEENAETEEGYELAQQGKEALDRGNIHEAISLLQSAVEKAPQLIFARNNLSLAYYCNHETKRALEIAKGILRDHPEDIHANCNIAIFYRDLRNAKGMERALSFIRGCQTEEPDELSKLALTLLELNQHELAAEVLRALLHINPYDIFALHQMGVVYYKLADYAAAEENYNLILKIDPLNTIAQFYKKTCRDAQDGSVRKLGIHYHFQVPHDEIIRRIRYLNDLINRSRQELLTLWQRDDALYALLKWGLDMPDLVVKRAMLSLAVTFADAKAQRFLKDLLLARNQSDELKRETFGLLKRLNAQEPFFAYIGGNFVEARVSLFETLGANLPDAFHEVLSVLISADSPGRSEECVFEAVRIWERYIEACKNSFPTLWGTAVPSFSAALEYLASKKIGRTMTKSQVCNIYDVSLYRLNFALGKLDFTLG